SDEDLAKAAESVVHTKSKSPTSSVQRPLKFLDLGLWTWDFGLSLFDSEKRLAVLNSLSVLDVDFRDFARGLSLNFIHQLHRFNDADYGLRFDVAADAYEAFGCGRGRAIKSPDDRRSYDVQTLIF